MHPKEQFQLLGHEKQEAHLLQMIEQEHLPSTLLFSGAKGIGKATFAYRLARYLLAAEDEKPSALFGPASFEVNEECSTAARIISGAHSDLMVLEPAIDGKTGLQKADIKVDEAREVGKFLNLTSSEGNWRVVIIDSADALNVAAANSLLKLIEEPPKRTLMILIAHNIGRLLPTIRSRCHIVNFNSLSEKDFYNIVQSSMLDILESDLSLYHSLFQGSAGQAITSISRDIHLKYKDLLSIIERKPLLTDAIAYVEKVNAKKDAESWDVWAFVWDMLLQRAIQYSTGMLESKVMTDELLALSALAERHGTQALLNMAGEIKEQFSRTGQLHLDKKQTMLHAINALSA